MTKEIEEALENLQNELSNRPKVKEYFRLKELIKSDNELMGLNENMRLHQKAMVESVNDSSKHEEEKELYFKAKNEYENHPLIVSYSDAKEEVYNLLKQISNIIND